MSGLVLGKQGGGSLSSSSLKSRELGDTAGGGQWGSGWRWRGKVRAHLRRDIDPCVEHGGDPIAANELYTAADWNRLIGTSASTEAAGTVAGGANVEPPTPVYRLKLARSRNMAMRGSRRSLWRPPGACGVARFAPVLSSEKVPPSARI